MKFLDNDGNEHDSYFGAKSSDTIGYLKGSFLKMKAIAFGEPSSEPMFDTVVEVDIQKRVEKIGSGEGSYPDSNSTAV